ncbi:MAG TPA: tRNA pseudouridine(55) synthase TruB [Chryseosolibacter sp.]
MEGQPQIDQVLLINKPYEWTSFDVVNKLRYKLKMKKIGHAGTLDPLATGLLIVCTGKMTKRIDEFMGLEKEYTGKFVIGQTTPSFDLETEASEPKDISHISRNDLVHATKNLIGRISQLPPMHSAIKIGGKRAYKFARQGKEVELQPRDVDVLVFDITDFAGAEVSFRIVCSKGTYIRSIARDFGAALGVGAYLSHLCRTRIGPYLLTDAISIDEVQV